MKIFAPRDETDLESMINYAGSDEIKGPIIIRYPRGNALQSIAPLSEGGARRMMGAEIIHEGSEWAIIGYGPSVSVAIEAMETAKSKNITVPTVVDLRILKPLDYVTIDRILMENSMAVVVEDSYTAGGIGEAIAAHADETASSCRVRMIGVASKFIPHAAVKRQWELCGLTAENIVSCYTGQK